MQIYVQMERDLQVSNLRPQEIYEHMARMTGVDNVEVAKRGVSIMEGQNTSGRNGLEGDIFVITWVVC